jgi:hypothetical protein
MTMTTRAASGPMNEASVHEQKENTEAAAEFQHDDEDRDEARP